MVVGGSACVAGAEVAGSGVEGAGIGGAVADEPHAETRTTKHEKIARTDGLYHEPQSRWPPCFPTYNRLAYTGCRRWTNQFYPEGARDGAPTAPEDAADVLRAQYYLGRAHVETRRDVTGGIAMVRAARAALAADADFRNTELAGEIDAWLAAQR